jgi:hypothetical protein
VGPRAVLDAVVKRKNFQPLPGLEPPIIQPVTRVAVVLTYIELQVVGRFAATFTYCLIITCKLYKTRRKIEEFLSKSMKIVRIPARVYCIKRKNPNKCTFVSS